MNLLTESYQIKLEVENEQGFFDMQCNENGVSLL